MERTYSAPCNPARTAPKRRTGRGGNRPRISSGGGVRCGTGLHLALLTPEAVPVSGGHRGPMSARWFFRADGVSPCGGVGPGVTQARSRSAGLHSLRLARSQPGDAVDHSVEFSNNDGSPTGAVTPRGSRRSGTRRTPKGVAGVPSSPKKTPRSDFDSPFGASLPCPKTGPVDRSSQLAVCGRGLIDRQKVLVRAWFSGMKKAEPVDRSSCRERRLGYIG